MFYVAYNQFYMLIRFILLITSLGFLNLYGQQTAQLSPNLRLWLSQNKNTKNNEIDNKLLAILFTIEKKFFHNINEFFTNYTYYYSNFFNCHDCDEYLHITVFK